MTYPYDRVHAVLERRLAEVLPRDELHNLTKALVDAACGHCICDTNPETTEGPQEDCPQHGRTYVDWITRGDLLTGRIQAASHALTPLIRRADQQVVSAEDLREVDDLLSGRPIGHREVRR